MPGPGEYNLTDDARVCIVQARFETLQLGGHELGPAHLVLGVIKGVTPGVAAQLFPARGDFLALCHALDSVGEPAPLSPRDILYTDAATAAILGAIRLAGAATPEVPVSPLHLLLGVHAPAPEPVHDAEELRQIAALLEEAGLGVIRLQELVARQG